MRHVVRRGQLVISSAIHSYLTNTGKISSSMSFQQYFQVVSHKLQNLFSTFGVVRNDFF